jgi:hyperosmotically inducible protein
MRFPASIAALAALALSPVVYGAPGDSFEGAARDAWLTGKIEMAFTLNQHLNPFAIDTSVEDGVVMLEGEVTSDIDRDLAKNVAASVDGVVEVKNELTVDSEALRSRNAEERRDFPSWFDDATTTAAVKTRLIANTNTKGLQIDVDTRDDVVTLSGRVASAEQKSLAGEIAQGTRDVRDVRNLLVVDDS